MEEPNYDAIGGAAAGGEMFGFVTPQEFYSMMGVAILYLAVVLIMVISSWKVFSKAGKPGIASLIPIWNIVVMVEMAGKPASWVLLMLVPCANIYFAIMLLVELAKRFGKSPGFGVGLILLPFIFWRMLAFGSAQYQAPAPNEPSGNEPSE